MANVQDNVNGKHYNCRAMYGHQKGHMAIAAGNAQQVLQATFPPVILCDPEGATIDLLLPAEADSDGLVFVIANTADAAEVVVVKDDSDTNTIVTLAQNEAAYVFCDGTTWRGMVGGIT